MDEQQLHELLAMPMDTSSLEVHGEPSPEEIIGLLMDDAMLDPPCSLDALDLDCAGAGWQELEDLCAGASSPPLGGGASRSVLPAAELSDGGWPAWLLDGGAGSPAPGRAAAAADSTSGGKLHQAPTASAEPAMPFGKPWDARTAAPAAEALGQATPVAAPGASGPWQQQSQVAAQQATGAELQQRQQQQQQQQQHCQVLGDGGSSSWAEPVAAAAAAWPPAPQAGWHQLCMGPGLDGAAPGPASRPAFARRGRFMRLLEESDDEGPASLVPLPAVLGQQGAQWPGAGEGRPRRREWQLAATDAAAAPELLPPDGTEPTLAAGQRCEAQRRKGRRAEQLARAGFNVVRRQGEQQQQQHWQWLQHGVAEGVLPELPCVMLRAEAVHAPTRAGRLARRRHASCSGGDSSTPGAAAGRGSVMSAPPKALAAAMAQVDLILLAKAALRRRAAGGALTATAGLQLAEHVGEAIAANGRPEACGGAQRQESPDDGGDGGGDDQVPPAGAQQQQQQQQQQPQQPPPPPQQQQQQHTALAGAADSLVSLLTSLALAPASDTHPQLCSFTTLGASAGSGAAAGAALRAAEQQAQAADAVQRRILSCGTLEAAAQLAVLVLGAAHVEQVLSAAGRRSAARRLARAAERDFSYLARLAGNEQQREALGAVRREATAAAAAAAGGSASMPQGVRQAGAAAPPPQELPPREASADPAPRSSSEQPAAPAPQPLQERRAPGAAAIGATMPSSNCLSGLGKDFDVLATIVRVTPKGAKGPKPPRTLACPGGGSTVTAPPAPVAAKGPTAGWPATQAGSPERTDPSIGDGDGSACGNGGGGGSSSSLATGGGTVAAAAGGPQLPASDAQRQCQLQHSKRRRLQCFDPIIAAAATACLSAVGDGRDAAAQRLADTLAAVWRQMPDAAPASCTAAPAAFTVRDSAAAPGAEPGEEGGCVTAAPLLEWRTSRGRSCKRQARSTEQEGRESAALDLAPAAGRVGGGPAGGGGGGGGGGDTLLPRFVVDYGGGDARVYRLRSSGTRPGRAITLDDLEQLYDLRVKEACAALDVGETTLKRICTFFGLKAWPYRKRAAAGNRARAGAGAGAAKQAAKAAGRRCGSG